MKNFIQNLSIKGKIFFIIIFPFIAFLFTSLQCISIHYSSLKSYQNIIKLTELTENTGSLIHELQKERGISAGYLGSNGSKFKNMLDQQIKSTDEKFDVLQNFLKEFELNKFDKRLENYLNLSLTSLKEIKKKRGQISAIKINPQSAISYYTNINNELLNTIAYMTHLSSNVQISNQITSYYNFIQSKEIAGIERAVLSNVFGKGSFTVKNFIKFIELTSRQDVYLAVFKTLAEFKELEFYKQTVKGYAVDEVERMKSIALNININNTKSFNIDAEDWFKAATNKINILKEVEDHLVTEINNRAKLLANTTKTKLNFSVVFFLLILVICIAFLLYISNLFISGIKQATSVALNLSHGEGDLTKRMNLESSDEIGSLGNSIDIMLEKLSITMKKIQKTSFSLDSSNKDLSLIAEEVLSDTKLTADKSNTVSIATEEMNTNMISVAAATEQASTNLGMVAAASEEMTSTITEIAQNSEKARSITDEAVSRVKNASDRMDKLGSAANEIGKVTESITEISEQTNLLALNATIEAARAGEAGKGFAVVASEIKELAKQTAAATLEIKEKIGGIQNSTTETITEIEQISKVIHDVNEIVATIAAAVEEQSTTSSEIAENVAQASLGIQEVTENIAQSSAATGEIAKATSDVNQSADKISKNSSKVNLNVNDLNKLSNQLKEIVGKFKL